MSFVKCSDVVFMVVEDATERFKPIWQVDSEKADILKQYCEAIDSVAKEFGGISYEVEVDEISMEISIVVECDEVIIESENHLLCQLIKHTVRYGFSASKDGTLLVTLVFPSIWVK